MDDSSKLLKHNTSLLLLLANFILLTVGSLSSWIILSQHNALGNAKLFTVPWTARKHVTDQLHDVDAVLASYDVFMTNRTLAKVNDVGMQALKHAGCRSLTFGGVTWPQETVSPFCNCIRNVHVIYARDIVQDTNRTVRSITEATVNEISNVCKRRSRFTQQEFLKPLSSTANTNILLSTLLWNTISFVTFVMTGVWAAWGSNSAGPGIRYMTTILIFIAVVLGFGVPAGVTTPNWDVLYLAIACGVHTFVTLLVIYGYTTFSDDTTSTKEMKYPKAIPFWVGTTINTMSVISTCNVLLQRRDTNFQMLSLAIAAALCVLGFVADTLIGIRATVKQSSATEKDTIEKIISTVLFNVWVTCAVAVFVLIFVTGVTGANQTPFSNSVGVVWVTVPLVLSVFLLLPNGMQQRMPIASSKDGGRTAQQEIDRLIFMREVTDFVARLIFTAAVIWDVAGTVTRDDHWVDIVRAA